MKERGEGGLYLIVKCSLPILQWILEMWHLARGSSLQAGQYSGKRGDVQCYHYFASSLSLLSKSFIGSKMTQCMDYNFCICGLQVHDSLHKSGEVSKETLAYYDRPDGADKLYHLRFLTNQARAATATFIAQQQFDAVVSTGILSPNHLWLCDKHRTWTS